MDSDKKVIDNTAIAAEGIKQLVEQGKKTLSATEQLASLIKRTGPSSPAALAFAEAGMAGAGSQHPAISQAVQSGVSQIQAASQPQSIRLFPPSFQALQASMLQAIARGEDPVQAAGKPIPLLPSQRPPGMPGLPVGSPGNPRPPAMPGLPVGSPGNPAPPNMPPLPSGGTASGGGVSGGGEAGRGFFSMPSFAGAAVAAGTGLGIARLIAGQTVGEFSAGHGLSQWNAEAAAGAAHVSSLTNMLLTSAREGLAGVGKAVNKAVWGTDAPWVQPGPTDGGERPSFGKAISDFFSVPWPSSTAMPDDVEHKHESGKTGVGDGVR